ncbi:HNH endonuclease [Ruficoccus sp. ZRK36]|uniref:HNH endonuclease n=1 Tax=Ruficoccus sp. ZRK36 TaxID=2866311 RepID=UPI001C72D593|nr:HNH endonuclease [Ruficoccus sp. ZRK36]QYY35689.1 HNH endonuclease [Ruficoccus sp. ZRK36]
MNDTLSRRVLVLNRLWQAVNIVGVKRALSLLMQEHAQVIETSDGNFNILDAGQWIDYSLANPPQSDGEAIHTIRLRLRLPHVMLLRQYDKVPTKEVKFNRQNVFERDGYVCQYCGGHFHERDLNLDHIIPRDVGGRTTWENIVTSCIKCNTRKANRLPHQAGMHLNRKPNRPRWKPFVQTVPADNREDGWEYFLK